MTATRLGEICRLISGQHIDSANYNSENRGIGYLTGPSDFGSRFPIVSKWTEYPKVTANRGDILVTVKGSGVGKTNLLDQDNIAISRQLMAVRVTAADPQYVQSFLEFKFEHFQDVSTGAAIPGISRDQLLSLEVPLPELPEQQRIVAILDKAFAAIATAKSNAEKNLQNARAVFDTSLSTALAGRDAAWVGRPLGDLCTITSSTRIFKHEYVPEGIPFYRTKEIKELANRQTISTELFISSSRFIEIKKSHGVPSVGQLLITAIGTIGEIYVIQSSDQFYFKDGNILWLKDLKGIRPGFLKLVLGAFVNGLNNLARGAAYSALPIQKLKDHVILVPPINVQEAIESRFDRVQSSIYCLESLYRRKLAALDELKKSLLHRAFNGDL